MTTAATMNDAPSFTRQAVDEQELRRLPRLIVAASETSADMLYATRFFVPDACVYLRSPDGRSRLFVSQLEVDRARREAAVDEIVSTEPFREELKKQQDGAEPKGSEVMARFLAQEPYQRYAVPSDFPLGLADFLYREAGIEFVVVDGIFWPERECKGETELAGLRKAIAMTEAGFRRAEEVLAETEIDPGDRHPLLWLGQPLTSERLRAEIDIAVLRAGGHALNTIVAGGEQACDPHERGTGPLYANELIIIDCFPRDPRTGFYGDLTRTLAVGQLALEQKSLWDTVLEGQQMAIDRIRPGVHGQELQDEIREFFTDRGFPTEERNGRWVGFFHGLGHGLGLDLHEQPRISRTVFKPGQVFTVEPGLYVPGLGGVRHEDIVVVTESGCEVLSTHPKRMEIIPG